MKIAVIGLGYWGPNLVRNFLSRQQVSELVIHDQDPARMAAIAARFPGVSQEANLNKLLSPGRVDAVVIATPLSTHYTLAEKALQAGCHTLVEKPFCETSAEAEELIQLAAEKSLTLMVDHTFLYTGAVRKMRQLVEAGEVGRPLYFDSVRVNLGLFQHDTNVLWDLAPHDFSILDHLVDSKPVAVQAVGAKHYYDHEDIAYVSVFYEDSFIAHFHVNWISPVKVRRILLGGEKNMILYDDMEPDEKIRVYDKGVELKAPEQIWQTLVSYRSGDMRAPKIEVTEALSLLADDFLGAIAQGSQPLSSAESGLRVVRLLEAADASLKSGGKRVDVSQGGHS